MIPFPAPSRDPAWILFEPDEASGRELDVESNLTVANGRVGVRGSPFLRRRDRPACRRTYAAGLYALSSAAPRTPFLASLPQTAGVSLLIDGRPYPVGEDRAEDRLLDLRRGVLHAALPAGSGPLEMRAWRFASQVRRDLVVEAVRLVSARDATLTLILADDPPPPELHRASEGGATITWRGRRGGRTAAVATTAVLTVEGAVVSPRRRRDGALVWRWSARAGRPAEFERRLSVVSPAAVQDAPCAPDAKTLLESQAKAWRRLWRDCDVRIEGDADAQAALRFGAYHLNSAVDPQDETVSVAARGLTGDGYRGHVFWDTDIYMLPFYVLTRPEAARALLMYRHRTLAAARAKARRLGWRGALYAWESADTGAEATPRFGMDVDGPVAIPTGRREQHISADVAYGVWTYWTGTGDDAFMWSAGAEILIETARFWASRATLEPDGRAHIRGVEGPDEYHEKVDDNAFTNGMAALNLIRAAETAATLGGRDLVAWTRLAERIGLDEDEVRAWPSLAAALERSLKMRDGVLEQFAGFFDLDDLVHDGSSSLPRSIGVLLGRARREKSQVIKQADVTALLALRPDMAPLDQALAAFRYYAARCDHDSSLSPGFHALAAAHLGDLETALAYFRETAAIDRVDVEVSSGAGVHMAAQGGLWQAAVLGFGGLSFDARRLSFDPRLPSGWRRLTYPVRWRGRRLRVVVDAASSRFQAALLAGEPTVIDVQGAAHPLERGRPGVTVALS